MHYQPLVWIVRRMFIKAWMQSCLLALVKSVKFATMSGIYTDVVNNVWHLGPAIRVILLQQINTRAKAVHTLRPLKEFHPLRKANEIGTIKSLTWCMKLKCKWPRWLLYQFARFLSPFRRAGIFVGTHFLLCSSVLICPHLSFSLSYPDAYRASKKKLFLAFLAFYHDYLE